MEKSPRIVSIIQRASQRWLDAHEIPSLDFNVVTRPQQNNNTQNWIMTPEQGDLVRIQQVSSRRFLDAHEIPSVDFRVVTRPRQENNTQLWHLDIITGGGGFTLRQASSDRFLDASAEHRSVPGHSRVRGVLLCDRHRRRRDPW